MKNTAKLLSLSILSIAMSGCVINVNAKSADVTLEESLSIDASSLSAFDIEAGSGFLNIKGSDSATEINVAADIRTTEEKDYTLELKRSGKTAYLVAKHNSTSGYWNGSSPAIDLTITVPSQLMLDIDDGSGSIEISGINNNLKLKDGSGSASIEKINGNLSVNDGSGSLDIEDIIGEVKIEDGSGSLTVKNIKGNIEIDDGSGSLTLAKVTGNAEIEDGSGSLSVKDVSGKVTIDDGSGGIKVSRAGSLKIIDSGSGELSISDVEGEVDIDS